MSATVPDTAAETQADYARSALSPRPWPRLALNVGGFVLELRGPSLFLRLAGFEAYLHTAEVSDWWTLREQGGFEAAAWRLRFSAARAIGVHEP